MKKIMLPTDFSENSINAMHYAMEFYASEACEFYILNVQKTSSFVSDDLMAIPPSETIFNSLITAAKTKSERVIKDLKKLYNNKLHTFKAKVDYDNFIDAINQLIEIEQIDIIIMGTKGATNLVKTIFGSNAARVIQRANCPVLAIPNDFRYTSIDTIVFTSNYLTAYHTQDLNLLKQIADQNQSTIHVLHVLESEKLSENQENNKDILDTYISKIDHAFIDLKEGDLFTSVTSYILENNIDMLAMMSRKHSFLERLFTRHPAESFSFDLKVPLLVMENTGTFYLK